jgi:heme exporter protein A
LAPPKSASPDVFVEIVGIKKAFGPRMVLKGIDLQVRKGEFLTVFGPNGAGKTTLMKLIATLSQPTSGRILIQGVDAKTHASDLRRLVGVVSHDSMLYGNLTAFENLEFFGKMYDVADLQSKIPSLLSQVGLLDARNRRVGTFSHGMQKRLSIARAFIHDPPLLLLDEPETGLDQQGIAMLMDTLQVLGSGQRTIVMTTHALERGLRSCTRAAILAGGRIVYHQPASEAEACNFSEIYRDHTTKR